MRKLTLLAIGLTSLALSGARAVEQPRGTVLELHSCELFAGGCVVSSEATLDGRYMLRAWNFTGGTFDGAELSGLQVALLQCSSENLAEDNAGSDRAIIYLPRQATATQRAALVGWLKSNMPELKSATVQSRIVPLQFSRSDAGYSFKAGNGVSVKTASLESCESGACGAALWYSPRSATTVFTVAVDRASQVSEPLLKLKWNDAGKRSVFLAKFGDNNPAKNLYVTATDLCGPADKLF